MIKKEMQKGATVNNPSLADYVIARRRYSNVPSTMGCSDWFTQVVRTNVELQAALKQARDGAHPSYMEVRLEPTMITPMSGRDFQRVYQISERSSEVWRPVAAG